MFRSWLSIVFLLVVSVLWIRPIKRKSVHRINLFIVFYADLLLLLQFFYCLILSADELSINDNGILSILAKIGIVRYERFSFIPLLFKAICTLTFCFTMKQEQLGETRARPTSDQSTQINAEKTTTTWIFFHFGMNVLTHVWVLMILLTMFIYAIYGHHVNLLKLCYMIYVLVFVISYQLSLRAWRKMTYALWMLVIVTSMVNLILIYTYQFDGFDYLWANWFGIDRHMWVLILKKSIERISM